jgi:hypothetical protein
MNLAVFILLFFIASSPLSAAELWLRESLVKKHANDILVTIQAAPDQIGKTAHPLKEDCDLHVPLRSKDIRVPMLGEIKNACSHPEGEATPTYWPKKLRPLEGQSLEAEGVPGSGWSIRQKETKGSASVTSCLITPIPILTTWWSCIH